MKKIISIVLTLVMLLSSITVLAADTDKVTVNMNGAEMQFDVEPIIENGRTLVPFRAIFEALGCSVSYYSKDGIQTVSAYRGDDNLMITIGENKMYFGAKEITLDVPAKIVNDRTLVPLRAVSEAFDTEVIWYDDINTVGLYPKSGAHKITSVTVNKDIKNNEGVTLVNVAYSYPVIENREQSKFIDQINAEYKANAESFLKQAEADYEDAQMLYEQMGAEDFLPYENSLTYTVNTDRMGILSITNHKYYYTGGAHGTSIKESRNFNLTSGTELKLDDILNGSLDGEIYVMVYDVFVKYFEEAAGEEFNAEWAELIGSETKNVRYYITDDSLVLYFDVYSVAPYAFGTPSVEIPYNENTFRIDLKNAKLDEYKFELEGNPTTGYKWEIIGVDNERLNISEEYVQKDNTEGLVGVGGTYKYTVKGLKPGNASLELAYIQAGKSVNDAEKAFIADVYVDKNNKITILNIDDDVEKVKIEPGL